MILILNRAASLRRSSSAMMIFFMLRVSGAARQSSSAMMIFFILQTAEGTDYTTATGACQEFF